MIKDSTDVGIPQTDVGIPQEFSAYAAFLNLDNYKLLHFVTAAEECKITESSMIWGRIHMGYSF